MKDKPNLIYILADDMGYGDLSCLNAHSKIRTTQLDEMAARGAVFTDAHSSSAVCTPSRYSILTGRYNWRSWLKEGITFGYDKPVIESGRMTVASLLREHGYQTACIGKWHLGWNWTKSGEEPDAVDFTGPISGGPVDCGFDYFYGMAGSLDMPPYVYVENRHPTSQPDRVIAENSGKAFWRSGPIAPDFDHQDCLPNFTRRAVDYIRKQREEDAPYFLYLSIPAPHTPILPSPEFAGKSGTNAYGDFCLMVDDVVGQIRSAVDASGMAENTIIVFTADNGCSPMADFPELATVDHHPSYVFRGHKADIFEGGHRIPLIVQWPSCIQPDTSCDVTVCLGDLLATCADIVGCSLPDNAGEDSVSNLPLWRGQPTAKPLREATVHHSFDGSFSIRQGKWKLEMCPGSGGWSAPKPGADCPGLPPVQLYNLEDDIGERNNVEAAYPEVVTRLQDLLTDYVRNGRSTPGAPQANYGGIEWPQLWWILSRTPDNTENPKL